MRHCNYEGAVRLLVSVSLKRWVHDFNRSPTEIRGDNPCSQQLSGATELDGL
jgi:hypothetical protein